MTSCPVWYAENDAYTVVRAHTATCVWNGEWVRAGDGGVPSSASVGHMQVQGGDWRWIGVSRRVSSLCEAAVPRLCAAAVWHVEVAAALCLRSAQVGSRRSNIRQSKLN